MAIFTFDGTQNVTATKADTVSLTIDLTTVQSITQPSAFGATVLTFTNGKTVTITDATTFADVKAVITIPNGLDFFNEPAIGTNNVLGMALTGTTTVVTGDLASQKSVLFGGLGVIDSVAQDETISIGGKGTFVVYANGGNDTINQVGAAAFDSTSNVAAYGGRGDDSIDFATTANVKSTIVAAGLQGADNIQVSNTGTTTIYGGITVNDSADGADTIVIGAGATSGTYTVFGNGGADSISATGSFDSASSVTVFGGFGNDTITLDNSGAAVGKAAITVYGGQDSDIISVTGKGGTTTIYGGNGVTDTTDSADSITIAGTGTFNVYGNAGDDTLTFTGVTATDSATSVTAYGGSGKDAFVDVTLASTGGKITLFGGADADTYGVIGSSTGTGLTIGDYSAAGGDKLNLTATGQSTAVSAVATQSTLAASIDAAAAASLGNGAGVVTFGGDTYVVVDHGGAGFNAATDFAIKLTGVTDTLAVAGSITSAA